jgi:hypothetical protein
MPVVPIEQAVFQEYVSEYGSEKAAKKKIREIARDEATTYDE